MSKPRKSSRQCQVDHIDSGGSLDKVNELTNRLSLNKNSSGWDEVISDAKKSIFEAEQRITDLRLGIKEFERRKSAGEPWPGNSKGAKDTHQSP